MVAIRKIKQTPKVDGARYAILLTALAAYSALAYYFRFTQDDAFITYRYVANFLDGHGLVYNIGERICGFTDFGWTVLLLLIGALKIDYIAASRIIGFLFGAGVIWLTFAIGRRHLSHAGLFGSAAASLLVGANLSLAYWSPAGLETAAFAFAVTLSLSWFLTSNRLLPLALAVAVLLRPEGAVVAGLLILIEVVLRRAVPRFTLRSVAIAFLLCLPYVLFMYFYYGSILPNPFYAKTAFGSEQFAAGLDYAWLFLRHNGLLGVPILICLLLWRKTTQIERKLALFVIGYTLYIVVIGGDVLKVHRFFVPILAPYFLVTAGSIAALTGNLRPAIRTASQWAALAGVLALVLLVPWKYASEYNNSERRLVGGVTGFIGLLRETDSRPFTVAATTIGALGYELRGHTVIDMLGLTDSAVARHPQPAIAGISTTWRELKYNVSYILSRQPDYIIFSTGMKASAPAEKALLLYPAFLNSYRAVTFPQPRDPRTGVALLDIAFRRVRPVSQLDAPLLPAEFADLYTKGQQFFNESRYDSALVWLERARVLGDTSHPYQELMYLIAGCRVAMGDHETGYEMLNRMVAEDSMMYNAHLALYLTEGVRGNRDKASIHRRFVAEFSPAQVPLLDSTVASYLNASGRP